MRRDPRLPKGIEFVTAVQSRPGWHDECPHCGQHVKFGGRGKVRYPLQHKCPHDRWCIGGAEREILEGHRRLSSLLVDPAYCNLCRRDADRSGGTTSGGGGASSKRATSATTRDRHPWSRLPRDKDLQWLVGVPGEARGRSRKATFDEAVAEAERVAKRDGVTVDVLPLVYDDRVAALLLKWDEYARYAYDPDAYDFGKVQVSPPAR